LAYIPEMVMNCDVDYVNKPEKYKCSSKLQDEIKTEKFELNKFHASKKDPFY
jgi:hypothetical protein